MQLVKYKVNKFRSVKGTEWINLDKLSCYVGSNESGKTNLLLPLWKFNPADGATKIDLLDDYPRDEFSKASSETNNLKQDFFIETLFEFSDSELEHLNALYSKKIKEDEAAEAEDESNEDSTNVNQGDFQFAKFILIKKSYTETFYMYLSNQNCEEKSEELESIIGEELFKTLCAKIPKFVYYNDYGNLDSDLYLPHVKENLNRIDSLSGNERMKVRTLKILFNYLKLNPDEILQLGKENLVNNRSQQKTENEIQIESRQKKERFAKLESAATLLTKEFQDWWKQGNYIFQFNADGDYFRIFVSDSNRPEKIELEARSKGLQWFFSFFLVFLAESQDNHKNCILLLDEPGLNLHPNAQLDLIKFFHQLSEKNQLIYTTHLPFLVDHNALDKVKAVYSENGLTKISNELNNADKEKKAIQPVNAAIGITVSQSLLIGCDLVIVEGISDQFYLSMIKNYLITNKNYKLKNDLVFIPVGGASGVKPVVSILQGRNSDLPIVLLDSDKEGKKFQTDLKNGFYKNNKAKILDMDSFSNKESSEIEDLIPMSLFLNCFDRYFSLEEEIEESCFDLAEPIMPQLKGFANNNDIDLSKHDGWKVEISKQVKRKIKKNNIPDEFEGKWIDLFECLQKNKTEIK